MKIREGGAIPGEGATKICEDGISPRLDGTEFLEPRNRGTDFGDVGIE